MEQSIARMRLGWYRASTRVGHGKRQGKGWGSARVRRGWGSHDTAGWAMASARVRAGVAQGCGGGGVARIQQGSTTLGMGAPRLKLCQGEAAQGRSWCNNILSC